MLNQKKPLLLLLPFLVLFFSTGLCFSQLRIKQEKKLAATTKAVNEFIDANNFEYALITWSISSWSHLGENIYCLIKQAGNWYLADVTIPVTYKPKKKVVVKYTKLQVNIADSLWHVLQPDSAFFYKQEDFDKLTAECPTVYRGEKVIYWGVSDHNTYYLLRYAGGEKSNLRYYAPDTYLKVCYPYNPEYSMLKGFWNTSKSLAKAFQINKW